MKLLLIRHGRPERIDHDPNGADPCLTELGHRQALGMAEYLNDQPLDKIYVSPQLRAIETAQPLSEVKGLEPVVEPGIAEFDLGHPSYIPGEERAPLVGAELETLIAQATAPEFVDRVRASTTKIIESHPDETVAAVCHGGVISIILNDIFDMPLGTYHPARYTSVSRIHLSPTGKRFMASFNESHWINGMH